MQSLVGRAKTPLRVIDKAVQATYHRLQVRDAPPIEQQHHNIYHTKYSRTEGVNHDEQVITLVIYQN